MASAVASSSSHRLSDDAITAIHNVHCALSPRIGVLSSPDVQVLLDANHLASFSDLLRPFEGSIENLTVRTSQLETRRCDTFPLSFDDLNVFAPQSASASTSTLFTPADLIPSEATNGSTEKPANNIKQAAPRYSRPELLLDEISARVSAKSKAVWENRNRPSSRSHSRKVSSLGGNAESLKVFLTAEDESNLERFKSTPIETLTPWFADTKSMVLNTRNVSEQETFGHPLAIMLVVSASSSDPMNAFAALFEASEVNTCRAFTLRPYVDPNILRYYVLLHDISTSGPDLTESLALLDNVKKTYGLHCSLLPLNSAAGSAKDEGASFRISKLYSSALRHERRTTKVDEASDGAPIVPAKESHSMTEQQTTMSTSEDESVRWNAAKNEAVDYGSALTEDDVVRIRSFIRDFSAQSLIPFLERCVSLWNEQLAASRKGLTGRLFGAASRKFFSNAGSVRGSLQSQPAASFATLGYYPHSSLEAQTRRLADFAFMTRDYKLAAAMYDLGRRDYANDKAVKYIAGANEMFGLSHLMIMLCTHSPPIDVDSYLASAGQHYLISPRQKGSALQLDSLRATLLYYEVYRGLKYYRSAPSALVRTATEGSGEAENDLEVAGAMLLEQAAIADLRQSDGPALRKCALHLVMAAHRYRSCGQKHLSLRCFQGAASFYLLMRKNRHNLKLAVNEDDEGRERLEEYIAAHETAKVAQWDLIEDHLGQELGQQAFSEGKASEAVLHLFALLRRQRQSVFSSFEGSSQKHEACLQEFLNCCKYLETDFKSLLVLQDQEASLSLVDTSTSRVRINTAPRHSDQEWEQLEKEALDAAESSHTNSIQVKNVATVNEAFWVELVLVNPLNTPLKVTSLTVDLLDDQGGALNSELATVELIDEVNFAPLEKKDISIAVSTKQPCKVRCSSVSYLLAGQVAFQESLITKGRRLNDTKEQRSSLEPVYAVNESTTVAVEKAKPKLKARFTRPITRLGLGEEVDAEITIENKGAAPLRSPRVIVNRPDMILSGSTIPPSSSKGVMELENDLKSSKKLAIPLPGNTLAGGASEQWPVLLRGSALGELTLRLLFVYESEEGETLTSQLQYSIQVDAVIDLAVQVEPSRAEDLQYHLRVDGINLSDPEAEETVTIQALSFISPSWKVVLGEKEGKAILDSFIDMPHMQRQTISTQLQSGSSPEAITNVDYTVCQLQSLLTGRSLDKDMSPTTTSVVLSYTGEATTSISPFFFLARKQYRLSSLVEQFPSIQSTIDLQRIFMLYEPNQVDIVAHWQLSKSKRRGQAFVFGLNVGPLHDYFERLFVKNQDKYTRSLYAEAEKEKAALWADVTRNRLHIEEDPILFDFVVSQSMSPTTGQHSKRDTVVNGDHKGGEAIFATKGTNGRFVFPVELQLCNLSSQRTRDVVLQLDNTLSPATTTLPHQVNAAVQASYIDRLTFRATLAPQSSTRIQARASINKLGNVTLAPVLVKSTVTGAESGQERPFQRWEHCPASIKVLQPDTSPSASI